MNSSRLCWILAQEYSSLLDKLNLRTSICCNGMEGRYGYTVRVRNHNGHFIGDIWFRDEYALIWTTRKRCYYYCDPAFLDIINSELEYILAITLN